MLTFQNMRYLTLITIVLVHINIIELKECLWANFYETIIIEWNFSEIFEFGKSQESLKLKTNFEIEFKINLNNYISLSVVAINLCQSQL
jgi:hypothetical protein